MESDNLSKDQLQFVGHIKSSCDHLLEMINDILDISKIEAGEMEVVKMPFDLRHMLRRVPLMAKYPADKKKIQIELKIDPDLGLIEADEVRIKQVLYNLLSNAIKFTDPGKRIGMNARKNDLQIIIEVWDEGIGITGKDLEKIFDPFKQVSHAGSGRPEGAGLGLAISKRIIELHGGSLSVESKRGVGSRFIICLPLLNIPADSIKDSLKEEKAQGRKERPGKSGNILVVEDNELNLILIASLLNRMGLTVYTEKLGGDGVKAALERKFYLILMDIQLPDMSGVDAMKMIREKIKERVPIIALTAYAMNGDEQKFKAEGFESYISKPVDIKNIRETVEYFLKAN